MKTAVVNLLFRPRFYRKVDVDTTEMLTYTDQMIESCTTQSTSINEGISHVRKNPPFHFKNLTL